MEGRPKLLVSDNDVRERFRTARSDLRPLYKTVRNRHNAVSAKSGVPEQLLKRLESAGIADRWFPRGKLAEPLNKLIAILVSKEFEQAGKRIAPSTVLRIGQSRLS